MGLIRKLKEIFTFDNGPSLEHTWEITRIGSPERFMEFALNQAPLNSVWYFDCIADKEKLKKLTSLGLQDNEVTLNRETLSELVELLPELSVEDNLIHHGILLPDRSAFLITYDNLTCVWLSKSIDESTMNSASSEYNFDYADTENTEEEA